MRIGPSACAAAMAVLVLSSPRFTLAQGAPPPYGPPITLELAKKMMVAAEAEARKKNWDMVISIVDSGGHVVLLQRMDNAQLAGVEIATGKAATAVKLRRPTKALQDAIAQAQGGIGLRYLTLYQGITPLDGGLLIIIDGKIAGGIGVSGAAAEQDAVVAKAGVDALGK